MASSVVKYLAVCSALTVLGLLFYLSEYSVINRDMVANTKLHSKDHHSPYVGKYNLRNSTLDLKGHFKAADDSLTQTDITDGTLHIEGLSSLLNQIKPHLISDSKLELAELPDEKYFKVDRKVTEANCKALLQNDESEIKRASDLSANKTRKEIPAKEYIEMASNCSHFMEKRGYVMSSLTKEEEDFPIAYSFLMFKAVEQSERLLRAIYRPQNLYCIHVDENSESDIYDAMTVIANCFDNVFIAPKRFKVVWGQMSVLEPELLCMEELWKRSKTWKYFINLTGQEFPLRTNYELVRILMEYNGANDVEGTVKRANKDRWTKAGTPPHNIVATKGSVHIIVNRGFVDYVLHDQRAKDFLNWTRSVSVPDETFFSSLNHNPHLGVPGAYKGLPETDTNIKPFVARFKNWGDSIYDWPCHGKRVRMICVFGTGDLPLLATRKEIFANKFYLDYQHFALDCAEEMHFNHTRDEYMGKLGFDSRWYGQLGFVLNKV